jgi:FecR protein
MRIVCMLLACALALAGCAVPPSSSSRGGTAATLAAVAIDGQRVARPDELVQLSVWRSGRWLAVQPGMSLLNGDRVSTGPRASAVIRFTSGSELYMRPNSRGTIGSFFEFVGEVFAKIRGAFAVETTFVRAAADGTAYLVRNTENNEASVLVFDGQVRMSSPVNAWGPFSVPAGMSALCPPRQIPVQTQAPRWELERTAEWVERLEKLAGPAPGSTTGGQTAGLLAVGALVAILLAGSLSSDRDNKDREPKPEPQRDPPRDQPRSDPWQPEPRDTSTPPGGTAATPPGGATDRPPSGLPLAAPRPESPGAPPGSRAAPLRDCRRVALQWFAVPGARDYLVTLEARTGYGWQRSRAVPPSDSTRAEVGPLRGGGYRWSVQARDARGQAGTASVAMAFDCPATPPVR